VRDMGHKTQTFQCGGWTHQDVLARTILSTAPIKTTRDKYAGGEEEGSKDSLRDVDVACAGSVWVLVVMVELMVPVDGDDVGVFRLYYPGQTGRHQWISPRLKYAIFIYSPRLMVGCMRLEQHVVAELLCWWTGICRSRDFVL
jgi:hypothetical protein